MKNILLISQYFYPEMISTGHILTELLLQLSTNEVKSSVICAQPTYYSRDIIDQHINYHGINIIRTSNTQYDKDSVKGKVFNSTSFFALSLFSALRINKYSTLIIVTNPPFLGAIGSIIKIFRKCRFILIIHDHYPDIAVNAGYLNKLSPIVTFWNMLNRWIFLNASFIVTLGRDVKQLIKEQLPSDHKHKVVYIPNWADPSVIRPVAFEENSFIKEIGLLEKFVVQYSGNMGLTHDMETIIEAANELRNQDKVHFLLIGDGGKRTKIANMVKNYRLKNVTLLPYQPRENLKNSLSASHVSLISQEYSSKGLSVPSKLYGIMASGRPAIAIVPEDSEVALTLKEYEFGIVTPPKDVTGLVRSINWLMHHEEERTSMGARAHKAFLDNFTVACCAEKYLELIRKISQ
jgi:colanic acid biosynthesis glycosyl transferase WcaI